MRTLVAVAASGLTTACISDIDRIDPRPVPDPRGSVTFVVSAPSGAVSAATRAADASGVGNAHFPDGVPAHYRNYSAGADTVAHGTMFGGWPDAEAERAAFERAVEAMTENYRKSPAATRAAAPHTGNATRTIPEGSAEDNRIDELVIVRFDASGAYVDNILVGGPGEPALTPDATDPTGQRWNFTLEGLEDGNYRAVVFANSRSEVLTHIDNYDADPAMLTIDGFRAGLRVGHTMTAATPWNADPTDATDDANGLYRPFPMSSQPLDFSIPNTRDFTTWPIDLVRPLAKINVRIGEQLRGRADRHYRWEIEQVVVRNLNTGGRLMPSADFTRNAGLLDDAAVNEQPGTISSLGYPVTATWDVEDRIFVWEQLAGNDPITKQAWGRDEFCLLVKLGPYYVKGQENTTPSTESGGWFRVDMLQTVDPAAENPVRVNLLRNHTYEVEITDVNTFGYRSQADAYNNAPHGLEFTIDARDDEDGDPGMNDNTYNGAYQLTTDRSVLVIGPHVGDQATVMVYTDYSGGFSQFTPNYSDSSLSSSEGTYWPRAEVATPLTFTVTKEYTGTSVRKATGAVHAGELHKWFTIVQLPDPALASGTANTVTDYVGAFWRADHTGERLIGIKPDKKWSAFVLGDADWVVLDAKPSRDAGVLTHSPAMSGNDDGFDREHNVESTVGWASGSTGAGGGYFRVGLRGSHAATPDVPARYALVMVVEGDVTGLGTNGNFARPRLIYLRQGEGADYVMRPTEPAGNGTMTSRPLARRFSPYNLTARAFNEGGSAEWYNVREWGDTSDRSEPAFTDYPTQAGAMFQWAHTDGVRAWHPTLATVGIGLSNTVTGNWNDIAQDYESCPEGYRRPWEGAPWMTNMATVDISHSEVFQSLSLDPVGGPSGSGSVANTISGFYADGYFDRRARAAQPSRLTTSPSAVEINTGRVAYKGHLIYNPVTRASLFFPSASTRNTNADGAVGSRGELIQAGDGGNYWTSSSSNSSMGWNIGMVSNISRFGNDRAGAMSIRCVAEPEFEPRAGLALAPPGVIGIRHSELSKPVVNRRLTIRGSSTYRGTDVERYSANGPEFRDLGGLESEPVYVVYFKWGSTVGMLGGSDGDWYEENDLAWTHPDYADGADWDYMRAGEATDNTNGYNIPVDYSPASLARGWGDPCDLVGGHTPGNLSGWKTPTGNPWTYFDGQRTSTPFGTGLDRPWNDPSVTARWKNIVAGGQTIGGAGTDNGRLWLVAAGYREDGQMMVNNTNGDYWAATVYDMGGEKYKSELGFNHTQVSGAGRLYVDLNYAMPIRCVKDYTSMND